MGRAFGVALALLPLAVGCSCGANEVVVPDAGRDAGSAERMGASIDGGSAARDAGFDAGTPRDAGVHCALPPTPVELLELGADDAVVMSEGLVFLDRLVAIENDPVSTAEVDAFADSAGLVRLNSWQAPCGEVQLAFRQCPTGLEELQERATAVWRDPESPFEAVAMRVDFDGRARYYTEQLIVAFHDGADADEVAALHASQPVELLSESSFSPSHLLRVRDAFVVDVSNAYFPSALTRYAHPNAYLCVEDR